MPILQQQHNRLLPSQKLKQLPHAQKNLAPQAWAIKILHPFLVFGRHTQREQRGQVRQHFRRALGEQGCHTPLQLAPAVVFCIVVADAKVVLENFDERQITQAAPE